MSKKAIVSTKAPAAVGPYSQGIRCGNMVFLSGSLGSSLQTGDLLPGVEAQTKQIFQNIEALLAEAGMTMDNVVKCTVFLADIADFATVNALYADAFKEPFPARSAFQVANLPKNALVEIEVIAMD